MFNLLKSPARISIAVIAGIVDVYSFVQIILQTKMRMLALVSNPWFWLFILVTITAVGLFVYFKWQDYKATVAAQLLAQKNEFIAYRKGVHEEFGRVYNQVNALYEKHNGLHWKLEELSNASQEV